MPEAYRFDPESRVIIDLPAVERASRAMQDYMRNHHVKPMELTSSDLVLKRIIIYPRGSPEYYSQLRRMLTERQSKRKTN